MTCVEGSFICAQFMHTCMRAKGVFLCGASCFSLFPRRHDCDPVVCRHVALNANMTQTHTHTTTTHAMMDVWCAAVQRTDAATVGLRVGPSEGSLLAPSKRGGCECAQQAWGPSLSRGWVRWKAQSARCTRHARQRKPQRHRPSTCKNRHPPPTSTPTHTHTPLVLSWAPVCQVCPWLYFVPVLCALRGVLCAVCVLCFLGLGVRTQARYKVGVRISIRPYPMFECACNTCNADTGCVAS